MQSLPETPPQTKSKLDVLFVNPGNLGEVYQKLGDSFSAIEPPTLTGFFATYARLKGLSVDILDAMAFFMNGEEAAQTVFDFFEPTLIVIPVYGFQPSGSTQNMPAAASLCRSLKSLLPNTPILITGTHPAALPERTLCEEAVDAVCDGEGPATIVALFAAITNGQPWSVVPGCWYWEGDNVVHTQPAPLLQELDELMPEPAYDLLPMANYRAHNWHCFDHIEQRQPYASLYTSLGCPFKCSFCCINAPFGKPSYRMWSPQRVIRTIDTLVNDYGIKNIKFTDEMFVLNKRHVEEICDRIIERGYDLNIWAYARVDTVEESLLEKLYKAGFRWLALGIESGSKHVRDGVDKGRFGHNEIIHVVRKIQEAGIYVIGNYIFGLPDDDMESMQATLDLALEANCEFANFYSAMAYPGSPLYNTALEMGWEMPDDWLGFSQQSKNCKPLPTRHLSAVEVLQFRDSAFNIYFKDAGYLAMVKDKFGDQICNHLKDMTNISLKRQLY